MFLRLVTLWAFLGICGLTAVSTVQGTPTPAGLSFTATLDHTSTVCHPSRGYTSVSLAVAVSGLDAASDIVFTLAWSCPALSQLDLTALALTSTSAGCIVDFTAPYKVHCLRTPTAAFTVANVRVTFNTPRAFRESVNVLATCFGVKANGVSVPAAASVADTLLLPLPLTEPTVTLLLGNAYADNAAYRDDGKDSNRTAALAVHVTLTVRTEGVTIISVMLDDDSEITLGITSPDITVTELTDDESDSVLKMCMANRVAGGRTLELRCLGMSPGPVAFTISPVYVNTQIGNSAGSNVSSSKVYTNSLVGFAGEIYVALHGVPQKATLLYTTSGDGTLSSVDGDSTVTKRAGSAPITLKSSSKNSPGKQQHMLTQALTASNSSHSGIKARPLETPPWFQLVGTYAKVTNLGARIRSVNLALNLILPSNNGGSGVRFSITSTGCDVNFAACSITGALTLSNRNVNSLVVNVPASCTAGSICSGAISAVIVNAPVELANWNQTLSAQCFTGQLVISNVNEGSSVSANNTVPLYAAIDDLPMYSYVSDIAPVQPTAMTLLSGDTYETRYQWKYGSEPIKIIGANLAGRSNRTYTITNSCPKLMLQNSAGVTVTKFDFNMDFTEFDITAVYSFQVRVDISNSSGPFPFSCFSLQETASGTFLIAVSPAAVFNFVYPVSFSVGLAGTSLLSLSAVSATQSKFAMTYEINFFPHAVLAPGSPIQIIDSLKCFCPDLNGVTLMTSTAVAIGQTKLDATSCVI
mgnify:CR=1 FL=1